MRLSVAGALLALSMGTPISAAPATRPGTGRSVLIVHTDDPYQPWVSQVTEGISAALEAAPEGLRPDLYVEHLDLSRFPETGGSHARAAWFLEKYQDQRMDAIIVVQKEGFDFIAPLTQKLWPQVPTILIENERLVRDVPLPSAVIPVLAHFEIAETLDLARAVLPGTRFVAFISGAPPIERVETDNFRRDLEGRKDGLRLIDLTGLSIAELQKRVSSLPEDTVVFYSGIRVDGAGRSFIPREALRLIAPVSNRPIFSVHGTMLGYGLVGGRLLDFTELGREGGNTVLRIFGGKPGASIVSKRSLSRTVFDDRELRRFRIPAAHLPAGSEVRFREQTLWNRYPGTIAAIAAALVIQGALIVSLLLERRRRGLAQALTGATLASLPGQVAVIDGDGKITQVNENWASFGASGRAGPPGGVSIGEDYLAVWRSSGDIAGSPASKGSGVIEAVLRGHDRHGALEYPLHESGRDRWFEMHVEQLRRPARGAVVVQMDVTQRHEANSEARLRDREIAHLNRVGAVGELAASLAHELNQPLAAILMNAQAARRIMAKETPDLGEVRDSLNDIIADDQLAGEVIHRLRTLLRKEETPRAVVNLNEVVETVLLLVAGDAGLRRVSVAQSLAPSLPAVFGDSVQLKQVVLNLIVNGLDAVSERPLGGREVRVVTSSSNGSVKLAVIDSGPGIRGASVDRVFDPFYTTKAQGLGMGLSICRSIIEAHGGAIRAENRPEGGASFHCTLPSARTGPS